MALIPISSPTSQSIAHMKYIISLMVLLLILAVKSYFHSEPALVVTVGWYEHAPLTIPDAIGGQPRGFHFDLLNEIAKRHKLNLEYVKTTRSEFVDSPQGAESLMMTMPIVISEERKKRVDFSWPVSEFTRAIAGRAKFVANDGSADLSEKKVANLQGTYRTNILEDWLQKRWIGGITIYETPKEIIDALLSGQVDFIFDESEFIRDLMIQYPGLLKIVTESKFSIPPGYRAFSVRKGESELLERINSGMREIIDDGTYSNFYFKYFMKDGTMEPHSHSHSQSPASYSHERLPAIEINEINNARAILNDYFNAISSNSDEPLMHVRSGLVDKFILEGRQEFDDKLMRARTRLNELLLLIKGQPKDVPYFAAFYYRQIYDLRDSFERMRTSIESYRHKFEIEHKQTYNNLEMIKQLDIPDPDLQWRKRWVETNFDSVLATKAHWLEQIDDTMKKTVEFLNQLNEIMYLAEQDSYKNYRDYYFYRFNFLGNTSGLGGISYQWTELLRSLHGWLVNLPTQIEVVIPDGTWWISLGKILLVSTVFALVFAHWMRRYNPFLIKRYLVPYLSAGLGVFFAISAQALPMIYHNFFLSLSMFAFSLAILVLVWKLRRFSLRTVEINPWIVSIFSLLVIDLMLVLLAPYLVVLAALVVLMIFNVSWLLYCYRHLRQYRRREIDIIVMVSGLIWLTSGMTAWMGYLYPAMFIVVIGQFIFMVVYAGLFLTRALLDLCKKEESRHPLLMSAVSMLVIPLTWLGLLMGAFIWATNIFNTDWLFMQLYNVNLFPDEQVDISLGIILNLWLMGVVINFLLHWISVLIALLATKYEYDLVSVNSTFLVIRYLVWILFLVFCLASLNIDWENLKWIVGGLSVGFGFALKDVLENFFAGIIILVGKQVRPGDTIEFGSVYGKVAKINIRATFVNTEDNALIAVPNSQIVCKEFRNWTLNGDQRRQEVEIIIAGQSDVPWVKEIMLQAMNTCDAVLKDPPADVLFMNYHDNDILLRARFWIQVPLRTKSISIVLEAIDKAFRSRGVVIAVPGFDIRLDSTAPMSYLPVLSSPSASS